MEAREITLALRWKICIDQSFSVPQDSVTTRDRNCTYDCNAFYKTGDYNSLEIIFRAHARKKFCSELLSEIHNQQLGFCHLLNCVSQTLTPQTRIFYSAVRHVIDSETGNVTGNHATNFHLFVGLENA